MGENLIEFTATPTRCVYNAENFKIYGCTVDIFKFPNLKYNKYGGITIKGDFQELNLECEYQIKAEEVSDSKYGYTYVVKNIRSPRPTTIESSRKFLQEILTYNQAETLLSVYPDIIDRIINDRLSDIDLNKTKGIKEFTFNVIKRKVIENYKLAEIVDEFAGLFSFNVIKKLYDKYTSVEKIKEKLKNEPYDCLCSIGGIGFKTADEMLLKQDKNLLTSSQRMMSCAEFVLSENENNGNTYMTIKSFYNSCRALTKECISHLGECMKDNTRFYLDKANQRIAKINTYETEKYIADRLKEGLTINTKWNIDTEKYRLVNGSELTDEQMQTMKKVCENNVVILQGNAGCVDCDTEYFNGYEWKRIADYKDGEKVLQYNENGTANLVYPLNYIKRPKEYLWHFQTKYGCDQCLSDEHNCYYITSKGNLYHKTFREIKYAHENNKTGFTGKFITTFDYSGRGIELSDDEIRIMVATFADGSFYSWNCSDKKYTQTRFHLKKDRKKARLRNLIEQLGYEYREKESAAYHYTDFYVNVPFRCKHFPKDWYNCNRHQMSIIADEIRYWDCDYEKGNRFSTTSKGDADFIQFVMTSLGYRTTISVNDRTNQEHLTCGKIYKRKSIEYSVSWTSRKLVGLNSDCRINHSKTPIEKYPTKDGYEYCFTVPSHMLVLRRNNKIFITGNCGKTFSTLGLINLLNDNHKTALLLAPTGRAAKVLKGYTNHEASTIHRGLGFKPPNNWGVNSKMPLNCDIVILDEFSMTDIHLFRRLLEGINFNKTKLLLIGDEAQIPSVGCGNLLHDLLKSKSIPTVYLDKVFRYGKGGLSTVATDVRQGKMTFNEKDKVQVIGEDNGFTYISLPQEKSINYIIQLYKKLLSKVKNKDDVLIVTSQNVGNYGTEVINNKIQEEVNPVGKYIQHGKTKFKINDPVIQCVNNYKSIIYNDDEGKTTFVSNGEIGIIKDILYNALVVDFDGVKIYVPKEQFAQIKLAYAISCFKAQGGQAKYIVAFAPKAHTFMLNSNLLYVAVTRAKEKCFLITDNNTYKRAIKIKENLNRNTFTVDLLTGKDN